MKMVQVSLILAPGAETEIMSSITCSSMASIKKSFHLREPSIVCTYRVFCFPYDMSVFPIQL